MLVVLVRIDARSKAFQLSVGCYSSSFDMFQGLGWEVDHFVRAGYGRRRASFYLKVMLVLIPIELVQVCSSQ